MLGSKELVFDKHCEEFVTKSSPSSLLKYFSPALPDAHDSRILLFNVNSASYERMILWTMENNLPLFMPSSSHRHYLLLCYFASVLKKTLRKLCVTKDM